jgi:hypothetical protein
VDIALPDQRNYNSDDMSDNWTDKDPDEILKGVVDVIEEDIPGD